jgi:cytochrome o ubiquinol oxidase operon protein cyoD
MIRPPIVSAGASSGSLKSYATGFIVSIVLTGFAFALVIKGAALPRWAILGGISGAAIVQILVHLHCFLHLNTSSAARWNVLALVFTVLIMVLFVGATLWIMSNLKYRMI